MTTKRILLLNKDGLEKYIYKNILSLDHTPYAFFDQDFNFKMTFLDKIKNLIARNIFNKKDYINDIRNRQYSNYLKKETNRFISQPDFDVALIIRPDLYSIDLLNTIKNKTKLFIAYQWDGLDRYPTINNYINLFDKFYCFNPIDCKKNVLFTNNFYFDYLHFYPQKDIYDITYIGFYYPERFLILEKLSKYLSNYRLNFYLKPQNNHDSIEITQSKNINGINNLYDYPELLNIHNQSKVILDLKHEIHNGLSFRFFEALQLGKKIITTNFDVINYDFYNTNNIFILNNENYNEIETFIQLPYITPPKEVLEKYSFSNWLNNLIED